MATDSANTADTQTLHDLCTLPTAAFLEDAVLDYVDQWARRRRNVKVETDSFGNRLLSLAGKDKSLPRLVLVAHSDHPAFASGETTDGMLHAEFRGGVRADHADGAKVIFFTPDGEVSAKATAEAGDNDRLTGATFKLPRGKVVPAGCVGMFDFGGKLPTMRGRTFRARACDDLAGLAAGLAALDELRAKKPKATVCVLVTRAEEVGFIGAIAAVKDRKGLLNKSDRVISIETSAAQAAAPIGEGCVLRIGDKTSVFNSGFCHFLHQRCEALAKERDGFQYRRALMPGGTCEGTAFDAYGYVASAVCVPLGNYHNMDREKKTMGPEFIDLNDWQNLVTLLADAGWNHHTFDGKATALRKMMDTRFNNHRHLFKNPAAALEKPTAKKVAPI